jgi:hypothetical protein
MTDFVFQHNSTVMSNLSSCWNSVYFNSKKGWRWPPPQSYTHNVWIVDNVLCKQPTGDFQQQGTQGLNYYMGDPPPLDRRFTGNVMMVGGVNDPAGSFPAKNSLQVKLRFADPTENRFDLVSPKWTKTTDGAPAGISQLAIDEAMKPEVVAQPVVQPQVATVQAGRTAQFTVASPASSWTLKPQTGSISAEGLYTAPKTVEEASGVTVCAQTAEPEPACASIVLLPPHGAQ